VGQFAAFVKESGCRTQAETQGWSYGGWNQSEHKWNILSGGFWRNPGFLQGLDHPVVCVTWHDAMFLKRDNGSPFNHRAVDEVLARFGVLPLNNPPYFPRYNGAKEKSIRDLKTALDQRLHATPGELSAFTLAVELTTHDLNHRSRRCLNGRTACAVFHDVAQQRRWNQRQRKMIFRLLLQRFGAMIGKTANGHQPQPATLWRVVVESWLRCQGLIVVRQNQNVSPAFTKKWSHN
jgi:hypothetical protein